MLRTRKPPELLSSSPLDFSQQRERSSVAEPSGKLSFKPTLLSRQGSAVKTNQLASERPSREASDDKYLTPKLQLFRQTFRETNSKLRKMHSQVEPLANIQSSELSSSRSPAKDTSMIGKLNPIYYSKMMLKSNIFKLARASQPNKIQVSTTAQKTAADITSPLDNRNTSLPPDSDRHTYYLKTQNKNPMNSKTSSRGVIKAMGRTGFNASLSRQDSGGVDGRSTVTMWQGLRGSSLEQKETNKPLKLRVEDTGRDTSREASRKTSKGHFLQKLINNSNSQHLKDDTTENPREHNYLLPHNQHALKRARGKGVKNSLLRTVFNPA